MIATLIPYFGTTVSADKVSTIVLALGAFFVVVGVVAGSLAYYTKGRADALIKLQKDEITVLKDTNDRLSKEREEWIKDRATLLAEINRMQSELKTVKDLLRQAPQLAKLTQSLVTQHQEVIAKLTGIAVQLASEGKTNG